MNAREFYLRQKAGEDPRDIDDAGIAAIDRPSGYTSMLDDKPPATMDFGDGLDLRKPPATSQAVVPPSDAASSPMYGPTEASLSPPKDDQQMPDTPPPPDATAEFDAFPQAEKPKAPERREDIEILRELAANAGRDDGFSAKLAEAQGRDRDNANGDTVSRGLYAATTRQPVQFGSGAPSEAQALLQQRAIDQGVAGQKTSAQVALANALRPAAAKEMSPIEAAWKQSQIERNRSLSDIERDRNVNSKAAADARIEQARAGGELGGKRLEEEIRHNEATEGLGDRRLKAKTGAGGAPVHIVEGDIKSVPEKDRALVAGLLDHSLGVEDIPQRGGDRVRLLSMAKRVDPKFDTVGHAAYKHAAVEQSTDKTMRSLDVLNNHLELAESSIPKNGNSQFYNKVANAFRTGTGDASMVPYTTASHLAADELGKVLNIGSEGGREKLEEIFSNVQSESQLRAAFATVRHLAEGARKSFDAQLARHAPGGGQSAAPVKMKFPDGSTHDVPPEKVGAAHERGGVEIGG